MKGLLYLQDGTVYKCKGAGAKTTNAGELVFNTSIIGYQELLTDPTCTGKILNMTYPLQGNCGASDENYESDGATAVGFIAKNIITNPSNYKNKGSLGEWLEKQGVPAIYDIDTRALTRKIRSEETIKCVISTEGISVDDAKILFKNTNLKDNLMKTAGTKKPIYIKGGGLKIAILDLGVKKSFIQILKDNDCDIHIFPYGTSEKEILNTSPQGLIISDGAGNPESAQEAVTTIKNISTKIPIFAVGLGHEILALSFGGKISKMKFGHRGSNHGVLDKTTGKSFIVTQNHGYAVEENSLSSANLEATHINLNDGTVEGIKHKNLPIFSVQFSPETNLGTKDSGYILVNFFNLMKGGRL